MCNTGKSFYTGNCCPIFTAVGKVSPLAIAKYENNSPGRKFPSFLLVGAEGVLARVLMHELYPV
jgi:hypothetical protein